MSIKPPSNSNRLVGVTGTFSEVSSAEVDERCSVDVDAPFAPRRRPAPVMTAREEIEALVFTPGAKRAPAEMCQREGCADSSSRGSSVSAAWATRANMTPATAGRILVAVFIGWSPF